MAFCFSLNPQAGARVWSKDEGLDESSAMVWQWFCSQVCAIRSQADFSFSFSSFFSRRENKFSILFLGGLKKKKNTILLPQIAYRISKSDLFPVIAELMVTTGMCQLLKHKSFRSLGLPISSLYNCILENGRIRS